MKDGDGNHEAQWTYLSLSIALFLSVYLSLVSVASIGQCEGRIISSICMPIAVINGIIVVFQLVSLALSITLIFACQTKRAIFGSITLLLVTCSFIIATISSIMILWHQTYDLPNLPSFVDLSVPITLVDFVIILIAIIPYRHYNVPKRRSYLT